MEPKPKGIEPEPKKRRILITGSKGTIGKILTTFLSTEFETVGLDLNGSDDKSEFVSDISDINGLEKTFQRIGNVDSIVHLAASADHLASWEKILKNNIMGTRNIYELARKQEIKRIVFASSTHLYGAYDGYPKTSTLGRPIRVSDSPKPDSDYGVSKGFGELLARQYYDLYGINSVCIRIGAVSSDNVPVPPYEKLWLSHNDVSQIFRLALKSNISFGVFFATSYIPDAIFDITQTRKRLGYKPQDRL